MVVSISGWFHWSLLPALLGATAAAPPTFLSGVRDLAYDASRQLVLTAAIDGFVSIIDVSDSSAPKLLSSLAPASVVDAHGLAYDVAGRRLFVASVSQASVTCIDVRDPARPVVLSTLSDDTALFYSTHLAYDAARGALFVASAGSGDETNATLARKGHSISSIAVSNGSGCAMTLQHRMTSWQPEPVHVPGVNQTQAYPVYTLIDPERPLLYVSNDARCTVEVIDISTLMPRKVGNYSSCPQVRSPIAASYHPPPPSANPLTISFPPHRVHHPSNCQRRPPYTPACARSLSTTRSRPTTLIPIGSSRLRRRRGALPCST
jgi:DNA-binding beta-propeller fold protein YncE